MNFQSRREFKEWVQSRRKRDPSFMRGRWNVLYRVFGIHKAYGALWFWLDD